MLGYFFLLFYLSSYWAPSPWPPLCVCLFCRMVGGLAWGYIPLGGRINSWVLWLIHWANSCSASNSPLLRCPSHPQRGAARRQCLSLPPLLELPIHFLKHFPWPSNPSQQRCRYKPVEPPPCWRVSGSSHISKVSEQDFPGLTSYRIVVLPQQCLFSAGAGCLWL